MSSLLRVALIALALFVTAGCTSKKIITPTRTVAPQIQASQEQMKQAILTTLVKRKWSVQRVNPTQIQAEITVREQFHVEIDINYSASGYSIAYRDSSGMDYKDGKIHKNYIRWVRLLDKGILRELRDHDAESTARAIGVGEPQPISQ
ncbi:hypothetical protein CCU68_23420 [Pseudomonas gingeri NCPPB 3146 = LMG 5327]|uniref:Lipoprotein n=2 Tax=Pseudomonas gingeri TaxID=117681 RepID=A0A7Y7Y0J2_9PSED|nr:MULTISPECIES: hypothetical protein [Pseudomonas]NVZ25129.1 hypothetical protein [Pseudomonas gingeri]NVZ61511.1 hypothetical protein [Pseudomonas gingeri]NVZ79598.1 hypothetical protein [Pseudomonas gingeri]NWA06656.1 hypothetical protein [Pseudomonas gingeri]NWC15662.1 hypothetical protein [Pseudomonas gingeri]